MRRAILLLSLALLSPGVAAAAVVTLTPAEPAGSYKPGGKPIGVLGITPGMAPDAVRAILTREFGNAVVTQENMGLDNHGVAVESQSYVSRIAAVKDTDEISVLFATPTTGNGVVEVIRQLTFRDETAAPTLQAERDTLIGEYGKPGFDGPAVGTGEVQLMAWAFHGNTATPCPRSSCRAQLSEGLEVKNLAAYSRSVKAGNDLTVVATLLTGIADPSRATGIVVVMSDAATKLRTLQAAIGQLKAGTTKAAPKPAK